VGLLASMGIVVADIEVVVCEASTRMCGGESGGNGVDGMMLK